MSRPGKEDVLALEKELFTGDGENSLEHSFILMKRCYVGGEVKDAMNMIKKKLNSERGASITWALLIFMVCAVVGSVVLVAGTAAAGRVSKLAENDRRYYAVTSTAGFLRDALGEKVTVERTAAYTSSGVTYKISFKDERGRRDSCA